MENGRLEGVFLPLPKDSDNESINVGDTLYDLAHEKVYVSHLMLAEDGWTVCTSTGDGIAMHYQTDENNIATHLSHDERDSFEKIEREIYHLVMSEYLDDPEGDVKEVMQRIKRLAG